MAKQKQIKKRECVSLYFDRIEGSKWTYNIDRVHITSAINLPIDVIHVGPFSYDSKPGPKQLIVMISKVPFKGCSEATTYLSSAFYYSKVRNDELINCKFGIARAIRHCTNWSHAEIIEFLTDTLYFKAYEFEHAVTFG